MDIIFEKVLPDSRKLPPGLRRSIPGFFSTTPLTVDPQKEYILRESATRPAVTLADLNGVIFLCF